MLAHCVDPTGDGVYHIDYRVIGIGDGVERWVSTHGRTTFQHGRPVAFIGAALDITDASGPKQPCVRARSASGCSPRIPATCCGSSTLRR